MNKKATSVSLLLLTALIWGTSFIAQSVGIEYVQTFTYVGIASLLGGLVLLPVIWIRERNRRRREGPGAFVGKNRKLLVGGIASGLAMTLAANLQQCGLQFTTAGKCGFITTFYVVLVPVFSVLLFRRRYSWFTWGGVALALVGMYFLCITESFTIGKGDIIVFLCAIGYAAQILIIDAFVPNADGICLSCLQFLTCGALSLLGMALFESPQWEAIWSAKNALLYSGILTYGFATTLQVVCQKHVEPTLVSLLLSLESVFAVIAGSLFLQESLSARELWGCGLLLAAVVIVELFPEPKRKTAKSA